MGLFSKKDKTEKIINKEYGIVHYEGIPGFKQDWPCKIKITEDMLVFTVKNSDSVVRLPLSKITCVDVIGEAQYMLKYHNVEVTYKKGDIAKCYAVITYTSDDTTKTLAFWYVELKIQNAMRELQKLCQKDVDITL